MEDYTYTHQDHDVCVGGEYLTILAFVAVVSFWMTVTVYMVYGSAASMA